MQTYNDGVLKLYEDVSKRNSFGAKENEFAVYLQTELRRNVAETKRPGICRAARLFS